jgi:nucleotide-binding universal stress UspA family protein
MRMRVGGGGRLRAITDSCAVPAPIPDRFECLRIEVSMKEAAMKPIVLATDGSSSAAEATLQAVELAKSLEAPLLVVAVEHGTVPGYGCFSRADLLAELTRIEQEQVERTLSQTRSVADDAGVPCEVVARRGVVAEEICKLARQRDARLIVIGAHGWGSIRRAWYGSVSTAVVQHAHCPVLVVRGGPELLAETITLDREEVA